MTSQCQSPLHCLTGSLVKESNKSSELWDKLREEMVEVHLNPGEILSQKTTPFEGIACVRQGSLHRRIQNGANQFVLAQIMVEKDLLGLECLFDEGHCQDVFRTREKTTLNLFPRKLIKKLVKESPAVAYHFFHSQSENFRELMTHLQVLSNKSLLARTAAGILYFNRKLGPRVWTNRELATWAGVTQEGVGRSFTNLIGSGVIRKVGRKTFIEEESTLVKMASEFKSQEAPHLISYLVRQSAH